MTNFYIFFTRAKQTRHRGLQFLQIRTIQFSSRKYWGIFFFTKSTLWYNHSIVQMCQLIRTVFGGFFLFLGERCVFFNNLVGVIFLTKLPRTSMKKIEWYRMITINIKHAISSVRYDQLIHSRSGICIKAEFEFNEQPCHLFMKFHDFLSFYATNQI